MGKAKNLLGLLNSPELLGVRTLVWPESPPLRDGLKEKLPSPEDADEGLLMRGNKSISREKEK